MQISSQTKAKIKAALTYGFIVGSAFWIPDVVIHGLRRKSFSSPEVKIMTFLLPLIAALSFYVMRKFREFKDGQVLTILSGVFGIWITGPFFMMLSSSFSEGGFARTDASFPESLSFIIASTALFPIYTFMMSTYDGTLFALFIVSGLIPLTGLINRKP